MAGFLDEFVQCDARIDELWQISLSDGIAVPDDHPVLFPCLADSLAVVNRVDAERYADGIIAEVFGGFNPINRHHLMLRSWLFEHACECLAIKPGLLAALEMHGGLFGENGLARVFVQMSNPEENMKRVVYGSCWIVPDEEGRFFLPERFVRFLGEKPVAFSSLSGDSVWLVTDDDAFQKYIEILFEHKFGGMNPASREHELLKRALTPSAFQATFGEGGHLGIPCELVETAQLMGDVVAIGAGDHVEIRPARHWMNASADAGKLLWSKGNLFQ